MNETNAKMPNFETDWNAARKYALELTPPALSTLNSNITAPDFLCLGAQKSGTTWLYKNLQYHPTIWLPPIKEISYFSSVYVANALSTNRSHREHQVKQSRSWWEAASRPEKVRKARLDCLNIIAKEELTPEWYCKIFSFREPDQLAGDISPEYSLVPREGARHALQLNPLLKVIVFLRDPADRALAHARMLCGRDCGLQQLWALVKSDGLDTICRYSDYPRWLSRWKGLMTSDNIHIEYFHKIAEEPHRVLRGVCNFLGIPYHAALFPEAHERVFPGPTATGETLAIKEYLREKMNRIYAELEDEYSDIFLMLPR